MQIFQKILAVIMIFSVCASSSFANPTEGTVSDTAITAYLKTKMAISSVSSSHVNLTTNNGIVALSGTMPTSADASTLIQMIASTSGVKDVDASGLKIKKLVDKKNKVSKNNKSKEESTPDAFITAKIMGVFLREKLVDKTNIPVNNIHVITKNAIVQLSGTAENQKQIDTAIKLAKSVSGVKEVQSTLTISSDSK